MLKAGDMSRPAPEIRLSTEEKETLLRWMRSSKAEQRMVQRARVILLAASGLSGSTSQIEDYQVELNGVWMLQLDIDPDIARGQAVATLASWRLA